MNWIRFARQAVHCAVLDWTMIRIRQTLWKPFLKQMRNPAEIQKQVLLELIANHRNTTFGREHDFESIHSYEDFRQRVPVHSYEDLRAHIETQDRHKTIELTAESPVAYVTTSGTTGKPKFIPLPETFMDRNKKNQALFAYAQYRAVPGIYNGKIVSISGQRVEGHLESGTPYGSMSGMINLAMPSCVLSKYAIPEEIYAIDDYALKYFLISAFALREPDVTLLGSANPSTFLKLNEVIDREWERLIEFLESGTTSGLGSLSDEIQQLLSRKWASCPKRVRLLKSIKRSKSQPNFADWWPDLKAVVTWTGGSASILIPRLQDLLSDDCRIIEMGYLASEFRGSINVEVQQNKCVPTFHENFFEFVEVDDWESGQPTFRTLEEIREGVQYYVIVTTPYGLYRYFIDDVVEVDGRFRATPTLRFVQKGKGVTNLTGEKLYESQVNTVMESLRQEWEIEFDFFVLLADPENLEYQMYIEMSPISRDMSSEIEKKLSQVNMEYKAKRESGRLNPLKIQFLKEGVAEAYKEHCLQNGQREGQFKTLRLQYRQNCDFDFSPFGLEGHASSGY